jgi:hypothetical protein
MHHHIRMGGLSSSAAQQACIIIERSDVVHGFDIVLQCFQGSQGLIAGWRHRLCARPLDLLCLLWPLECCETWLLACWEEYDALVVACWQNFTCMV